MNRARISPQLQNVMNSTVSERDSLFHACLVLKRRLEAFPQLRPYLNLAKSTSELLSEKQSLLLSQKQQQQLQELRSSGGRKSVLSAFSNRDSHDVHSNLNGHGGASGNNMRISSMSSSSLQEDISMDGITYTTSNSMNLNMEDTLLTFSMGILPISMECDPVTQLSQLFQQGSPLCIIFNAVKPQFKLNVISSDDLKVIKKSIFDFVLGCKQHFAFVDEELFTISDVFSNYTTNLIKIIDVVKSLLDSAPEVFPPEGIVQEQVTKELHELYPEPCNVIKEFVATERKYVHDLEILDQYRQQLLDSNLITSEELYMLFPNLSDAIDFQRRFLVSLEINALVEPAKQRIGALFMHSKYFFKLYEPWSIGQNAAIDFLSATYEKSANEEFVIKNKLELQAFLYKPVQRLCRYPLLLRELVQETDSDKYKKEMDVALNISKGIARSINENQRRTENHQVVKKLYDRVTNWKGYRVSKFGELIYYDTVSISTNNPNEQERDFEVYLFEKIIILFSEVVQKKSASLILKKNKSSSSGSSLSLNLSHNNSGTASPIANNSSNSNYNKPGDTKLDLRGRIMIINLTKVAPTNSRSLSVTWESVKEKGNFILKFRNDETRDNWESCLQSLMRVIKSQSFKSTASGASDNSSFTTPSATSPLQYRSGHDSVHSMNSMNIKHVSDMLPKRRTSSSFENEHRTISENYKSQIPDSLLLIRITHNSDYCTILIEFDAPVTRLLDSIQRKLNYTGLHINKLKYQDEDGDYVVLESEEDWMVAKDMLKENDEKILNIWAYSR